MNNTVVLTPEEAAEILKIGMNSIYALLRSGKIHAVRIGRLWRIPIESITLYLENTN